jgi:hypothetical protein
VTTLVVCTEVPPQRPQPHRLPSHEHACSDALPPTGIDAACQGHKNRPDHHYTSKIGAGIDGGGATSDLLSSHTPSLKSRAMCLFGRDNGSSSIQEYRSCMSYSSIVPSVTNHHPRCAQPHSVTHATRGVCNLQKRSNTQNTHTFRSVSMSQHRHSIVGKQSNYTMTPTRTCTKMLEATTTTTTTTNRVGLEPPRLPNRYCDSSHKRTHADQTYTHAHAHAHARFATTRSRTRSYTPSCVCSLNSSLAATQPPTFVQSHGVKALKQIESDCC